MFISDYEIKLKQAEKFSKNNENNISKKILMLKLANPIVNFLKKLLFYIIRLRLIKKFKMQKKAEKVASNLS